MVWVRILAGAPIKRKVKNIKRKIKTRNQVLFIATILLFLVFGKTEVWANGGGEGYIPVVPNGGGGLVPCGTTGTDPCTLCDLFVLINNIFTYFFTIILPVVVTGLMGWGGFTLLTAGENKTKFEEAKNIITATVIGLVIILASWIFLNMFLSSIGVAEWTGLKEGWWKIECL